MTSFDQIVNQTFFFLTMVTKKKRVERELIPVSDIGEYQTLHAVRIKKRNPHFPLKT